MKLSLFIALIIMSHCAFAQVGEMRVCIIYSDSIPRNSLDSFDFNKPVFVELFRGKTSMYHSYQLQGETFIISNLDSGHYKLLYTRMGLRSAMMDVDVVAGKTTFIQEYYPGPCKFRYKGKGLPRCLDGHKDQIVPIIYGFPNHRMMKQSKAGKIHLGGCVETNCDPKYFCNLHQREL